MEPAPGAFTWVTRERTFEGFRYVPAAADRVVGVDGATGPDAGGAVSSPVWIAGTAE